MSESLGGNVSFHFEVVNIKGGESHYSGRGYVSLPMRWTDEVRTYLDGAWRFVREMLIASGRYECSVCLEDSETWYKKLIEVHGSTIRYEVDWNWVELLEHTLGAGPRKRRSQHGTRNAFCAGVGSKDHQSFLQMVNSGFARSGQLINEGGSQYFHATKLGCEMIGLSKAATRRAFGDSGSKRRKAAGVP